MRFSLNSHGAGDGLLFKGLDDHVGKIRPEQKIPKEGKEMRVRVNFVPRVAAPFENALVGDLYPAISIVVGGAPVAQARPGDGATLMQEPEESQDGLLVGPAS